MPVPGVRRSTMTDVLRRSYVPGRDIQDTINLKVPFLQMIETEEKLPVGEGDKFQWGVELTISPAQSDAIDTDQIPEAGVDEEIFASGNFTEYRRVVQLTYAAIIETEAMMRKPLKRAMSQGIKGARLHHARSIMLPKTNLLVTCVSASDANTLLVAAPGAQYLQRKMRVEVVIAATGQTGAGVGSAALIQVDSWVQNADNTATLTLSGDGVGASFADIDTTYAVYPANSRNRGIWGLPDIISNVNPVDASSTVGNYGEITREGGSAVPEWRAQQLDGLGATIDGPVIAEMLNAVDIESPFEETDLFLLVHHDVMLDLENKVVNDRIFQQMGGNFTNLDLWGRTVHFGKIPIFKDRFCQKDRMYFVRRGPNGLKIAHPPGHATLTWLPDHLNAAGIWSRVPNFVAYQALLWRRWELIAKSCNHMGVITDIANNSRGTIN